MARPPAEQSAETVYLNSEQVTRRYGRRGKTWVWRAVKAKRLPPPAFYLCGQKLWALADLEAMEAAARTTAPTFAGVAVPTP
jgi:hypothetical protein